MRSFLKEAKNIWPEARGINNISEMLKITEQKYYLYINRANKIRGKRIFTIFVSRKRILKVLRQSEKALRLCPNSKEANNLKEEINDLFVKEEIRWDKIKKMFNRRKFKKRKKIDKTCSLKKITRKKKLDGALNFLAKLADPNYGYPSIYKEKRNTRRQEKK